MLVGSIGQLATAAVHILNNSPASNQHNIERHGAGFTVYVLSLYSRPANAEPCRSQRRCTRLNIHFRFTAGRNRPAIPAFLPPSAFRAPRLQGHVLNPASSDSEACIYPFFARFADSCTAPRRSSAESPGFRKWRMRSSA